MQAFYYLPADVVVKSAGVQLELTGYHDEYSLWFSLKSTDEPSHQCARIPRPFCNCSVHLAVSRPRLGQINDEKRTAKYVQALQKVVHPETICLTLGDCCHLSLIVSKLGARKVYAIEPNPHCRRVLEGWIKTNRLEEIVHVLDGDESKMQLDAEVQITRQFKQNLDCFSSWGLIECVMLMHELRLLIRSTFYSPNQCSGTQSFHGITFILPTVKGNCSIY